MPDQRVQLLLCKFLWVKVDGGSRCGDRNVEQSRLQGATQRFGANGVRVLTFKNERNAGMAFEGVLNDHGLDVAGFVVSLAEDEVMRGLASGEAESQFDVGFEIKLTGSR